MSAELTTLPINCGYPEEASTVGGDLNEEEITGLRKWQMNDRCSCPFNPLIPLVTFLATSAILLYSSLTPCYSKTIIPSRAGAQWAISVVFLASTLRNRYYYISSKDLLENKAQSTTPLLSNNMYKTIQTPCGTLVRNLHERKHTWDFPLYGLLFMINSITLIATTSICLCRS